MIEHVSIFYNDTSTMNMEKNLVHHKRIKHIDVRNHLLRDNVENGHISMNFARQRSKLQIYLSRL